MSHIHFLWTTNKCKKTNWCKVYLWNVLMTGKNVYFVAVIYMNELDVTCKIQCSCGMTGWVQYKPEAIICCATALVYKAFFCYLKSAWLLYSIVLWKPSTIKWKERKSLLCLAIYWRQKSCMGHVGQVQNMNPKPASCSDRQAQHVRGRKPIAEIPERTPRKRMPQK